MADDWWTGSPSAGVKRAVELGLPLPPIEVANNPVLREVRNARVMAGLPSDVNVGIPANYQATADMTPDEMVRTAAAEAESGSSGPRLFDPQSALEAMYAAWRKRRDRPYEVY